MNVVDESEWSFNWKTGTNLIRIRTIFHLQAMQEERDIIIGKNRERKMFVKQREKKIYTGSSEFTD